MAEITLHGFAPSPYTRTARMAAHEKGVAAELRPLAFGEPAHFALHPFGKMPVMVHGAVTLFETLAIVSYIDEAFDGPRLIPSVPIERARTLAAVSVAIDYAYRPVVHGEGENAVAVAARTLDWLEAAVADGGHVAAGRFTAADLFLAPMVDYHRGKVGDDMTFGSRPQLRAWLDAIAARPSFAATAA